MKRAAVILIAIALGCSDPTPQETAAPPGLREPTEAEKQAARENVQEMIESIDETFSE